MNAVSIDLPPVWLAGFAALGGVIGWLVPVVMPYHARVGSALVVIGVVIAVTAVIQMALARTTIIPGRDPSRMVTGGLFSVSRNPIYLADAILLAGLYIAWGALIALPLVLLFLAVMARRFVAPEEERLQRLFGKEFTTYRNKTRRWI